MRVRTGWGVAVVLSLAASLVATAPGEVSAAPPGNDQIIAFVARGVGNGHGRGMSQWGAYGRAVNGGQSWQTILDSYYGGTANGAASEPGLRIRLTGWDGDAQVTVISPSGQAQWNGSATGYGALFAFETAANQFDVWGAASPGCWGSTEPASGWVPLASATPGPIVFSTTVDAASAASGDVLGVCEPDGSITHYRGLVEFRNTTDGNRLVNQLDAELYLPRRDPQGGRSQLGIGRWGSRDERPPGTSRRRPFLRSLAEPLLVRQDV